jgi:putative transposase
MTNATTLSSITLAPSLEAAWQDVDSSFERFCLTAGIGALEQMLCEDAQRLAGNRHGRRRERAGHRWGTTKGPIGFHGGKVVVRRPRVRSDGHEVVLPSWRAAQAEDWLGRWAMNLMLINVSTRKLKRAVRLPTATCRLSRVTARRNRRLRAGSWRCPPNAWPSGWPRTCRSSIC